MAYEFLTSKNVSDLIGKKIKWTAPAYSGNKPYIGISIINSIDFEKRKPLTCETIEGDELNYAFMDGEDIVYSDSDRQVTFEIINDSPKKEPHTVKCNYCDFEGYEEDLVVIEDKEGTKKMQENGNNDREFFRACPNCLTDENLMDIEEPKN